MKEYLVLKSIEMFKKTNKEDYINTYSLKKKSYSRENNELIAKGIGMASVYDYKGLELADKYVKEVIENAEYMKREKSWTMLFYPIENVSENTFVYEINGKLYGSVGTNVHSKLVEYYKMKEKEPYQISIFDIE